MFYFFLVFLQECLMQHRPQLSACVTCLLGQQSHSGQFGPSPPIETSVRCAGLVLLSGQTSIRGNRKTEVVSGKRAEVSVTGQFQFQSDLIRFKGQQSHDHFEECLIAL
ncbi:hypothetical protein GOODEAATRI_008402 [Goodea atripinnis]|uniref:Secreted protein n=1 Tax=Goodea atripinnis TaxID=208336 RepID=A0ABV0MSA2_9TELE